MPLYLHRNKIPSRAIVSKYLASMGFSYAKKITPLNFL